MNRSLNFPVVVNFTTECVQNVATTMQTPHQTTAAIVAQISKQNYPMQRIDVKLSKHQGTKKERILDDCLLSTDLFINETIAGRKKPVIKKTFEKRNTALAGLFREVAQQTQKGFNVIGTEVYD